MKTKITKDNKIDGRSLRGIKNINELYLCKRCNIMKSISEFTKDKSTFTGHHYYCKKCCYNIYKNWLEKDDLNKEKIRKSHIKYMNKRYKSGNGYGYKEKAISISRKIVRKLKEENKFVCSYPNGKCRGRLEQHHVNYDEPFNIKIFCKKHHILADNIRRLIDKKRSLILQSG